MRGLIVSECIRFFMFLISSRECFGIERSGRFEIGMKEETEVWLILVLFVAIRERFRYHDPVPIRGCLRVLGTGFDLRVLV